MFGFYVHIFSAFICCFAIISSSFVVYEKYAEWQYNQTPFLKILQIVKKKKHKKNYV